MSTKAPPTLVQSEPYSCQIVPREEPIQRIHYVNSMPGAGKTYAALSLAAATVRDSKSNYVLVYAAPTKALQKQFQQDLTHTWLKDDPDLCRKIHLIVSDKHDDTVTARFERLLNSGRTADTATRAVPNGSVIIVTHECLALTRLTMPGKERVSLIFDEARQCLLTSVRIKMPERVLAFIRDNHVHIDRNPKGRWDVNRWSWLPDTQVTRDQIKKLWSVNEAGDPVKVNEKQIDRCMKFVNAMQQRLQDVWVSVVSTRGSLNEMQVTVVFSAARMFARYGRVLILSAFFENSQMYHLLKSNECDPRWQRGRDRARNTSEEDRAWLIDVTRGVIDTERADAIIKKRLSRATATHILEDESLSKYHINMGIVVPYMTEKKRQEFSERYCELFYAEGHDPTSVNPTQFKKFLHAIRSEREGEQLLTAALARRDLLLSAGPSKLSVIQFLVKAAKKLQSAWLDKSSRPREQLLILINKKASKNSKLDLIEEEGFSEVAADHVFAPFANRGLNDWAHLNSAAFLATTKMSAEDAKFMETILPDSDYDPDLDRTVDQCVQFLFRISVRRADANSRTLFVMSDRKLLGKVNAMFNGYINTVEPDSLISSWRAPTILTLNNSSTERKKTAVREYQKGDRYREYKASFDKTYSQTENRKRDQRLNSRLRYIRSKLAFSPDNPELLLRERELLAERARNKKTRQ